MTDQCERDVDDSLGEAAAVHDLAGQHEEGDGHQGKTVGAVDDVLGDDLRVENIERMHQRDAADDQRKRDRHAQRHRAEQGESEDRERHDRPRAVKG